MYDSTSQVTLLLSEIRNGDADARDRLIRLIQNELRRMAHAYMRREGQRGDMQTTILVDDVCLKLLPSEGAVPADGRQFRLFAARAMRQMLVDNARKRDRLKRGGGQAPVELAEEPAMFGHDPADVLAREEALERLERQDPRFAGLVEMRFYCRMTGDEIAEALGISPRQVDDDWAYVRAILFRELA